MNTNNITKAENMTEEKHLIYISTTYYEEYSNYYVGKYEEYFTGDYVKTSNNLCKKGYMVSGYKILKKQNEKFVVCNEKEMYDLRTAYRKRIINKEDLQEIYNIYSFYFNYDE